MKVTIFRFNIMFLNHEIFGCILSTLICNFTSLSILIKQIGGTEEYKICQGIREDRITKPVVCWCIGTCATMFASEVCLLC